MWRAVIEKGVYSFSSVACSSVDVSELVPIVVQLWLLLLILHMTCKYRPTGKVDSDQFKFSVMLKIADSFAMCHGDNIDHGNKTLNSYGAVGLHDMNSPCSQNIKNTPQVANVFIVLPISSKSSIHGT